MDYRGGRGGGGRMLRVPRHSNGGGRSQRGSKKYLSINIYIYIYICMFLNLLDLLTQFSYLSNRKENDLFETAGGSSKAPRVGGAYPEARRF